MYRLLALDLDGTVLSDDHTISPRLEQAIKKAKEKYHVMIVTGRHHTAAKPYHQQLGLTTPAICCNGTYVYDFANHEVVAEDSLSKSDAHQFYELANELDMKIVLYVTHSMMYSSSMPVDYIAPLVEWAEGYPEDDRPSIVQVDDFPEQIDEAEYVWKFVAEGDPDNLKTLTNHPWVAKVFNGEQSWFNRVDYSAQGNSKGNRLAQYCKSLNIDASEVIAVGDNFNDLSMITWAGLGAAMGNAADEIKQQADLVCRTDSNGDGLAELIETALLRE